MRILNPVTRASGDDRYGQLIQQLAAGRPTSMRPKGSRVQDSYGRIWTARDDYGDWRPDDQFADFGRYSRLGIPSPLRMESLMAHSTSSQAQIALDNVQTTIPASANKRVFCHYFPVPRPMRVVGAMMITGNNTASPGANWLGQGANASVCIKPYALHPTWMVPTDAICNGWQAESRAELMTGTVVLGAAAQGATSVPVTTAPTGPLGMVAPTILSLSSLNTNLGKTITLSADWVGSGAIACSALATAITAGETVSVVMDRGNLQMVEMWFPYARTIEPPSSGLIGLCIQVKGTQGTFEAAKADLLTRFDSNSSKLQSQIVTNPFTYIASETNSGSAILGTDYAYGSMPDSFPTPLVQKASSGGQNAFWNTNSGVNHVGTAAVWLILDN